MIYREIEELSQKTEYNRLQFAVAELKASALALEMAKFELSVGNRDIARREVEAMKKGIQVLERLLPRIRAEQRDEIERKTADLKAALHAFLLETRFF